MQMELESARQVNDSHAKTPRSSSSMRAQQPSPLTNKKNEDAYDVEAALLSGGGKGFVPLAGVLKRQRVPLCSKPLVWLAHQVGHAWGMLVMSTAVLHCKLYRVSAQY